MRKSKLALRNIILPLALVVSSSLNLNAWSAPAPEDLQLKAYLALVKADGARDRNNSLLATDQYRRAMKLYEDLQNQAPTYKSQIVNYRLKYCANQVKALSEKTQGTTQPEVQPPSIQKAQLDGLMKENDYLKSQLEKMSTQATNAEDAARLLNALKAAQERNQQLENQISSLQKNPPAPDLPVARKNPLEDLAEFKKESLARQDALLREIESHKLTSITLLKRAEQAESQAVSANNSKNEHDTLVRQTREQIEERDLAIAELENELNRIKTEYNDVSEVQNRLAQQLDERNHEINTLHSQLMDQRNNAVLLQNELSSIQTEVAQQKQPSEDLSGEVARLNAELNTLRQKQVEMAEQGGQSAIQRYSQRSTDDLLSRKQEELNEAMKRLARAEAAIRALSKEAAEGRKAARAYEAMAEMEKELRATKKDLADMERLQSKPSEKIVALEETVSLLESRIADQNRDLKEAVSTRDILQAQREDLAKKLNESRLVLESTRMQLAQSELKGSTQADNSNLLAQIAELEAEVDKQKAAVEFAKQEQKEYAAQQDLLEEQIQQAKSDKERLTKLLIRAAEKATQGEKELSQQIEALEKKLATQSQQLELSSDERDSLLQAKETLEKEMAIAQGDLAAAQKALKEEAERLEKAEKALAKLEDRKNDAGQLKKDLSALRKTHEKAEATLDQQAKELNQALEQIADYEKQLSQAKTDNSKSSKKVMDDLKNTRERNEELQANYEEIAKALREAEREVGQLEIALARAQEENIRLKDSLTSQSPVMVLGEGRTISELEKTEGAEKTETLEAEILRLQLENESGRAELESSIAQHDAEIQMLTAETEAKRKALEQAVAKIQEYQEYASSLKSSNQRKIKALVKKIEELSGEQEN